MDREGGDNDPRSTSALLVLGFGTDGAERNTVSLVSVGLSREGKAERELMGARQGSRTHVLVRVLEDRSARIWVIPGIGSLGTDGH